MNRVGMLAIAVTVAIGAAVAVMFVSPPDTGPDPAPDRPVSVEVAPVPAPRVAEAPVAAPEPIAPAVGPNGQPITHDREIKTEGLPERPEPLPPIDDEERWKVVRAEADRRWREQSMDIAERFAEQHHLSDDDRDAVLSTLDVMHADLAAIRAEIEDGTLHPRQGRQEMEEVRGQAMQELIEDIGASRTKALQEELNAQPGGGFGPIGE